jgi:lycopene beta-cyclase
MKQYDYIILGAGASGLSLACRLAESPLHDRSILLVEKSLHEHERKTWAYWERAGAPLPFGDIAFHTWRRLLVATPTRTLALRTRPYRYKAIRSADFYRYAHEKLAAFPNIEFVEGDAGAVEDTEDGASVRVGGEEYQGQWLFDSTFKLNRFRPAPRYRYLKMQVRGWEIETERPSFDPQVATFMDFRTLQRSSALGGGMSFLYVLPSDARYALVEHVACIPAGGDLADKEEEEQALRNYIERTLGITGYRVAAEEDGVNPMTDYPFPRRKSPHVMAIGIAGGMLKPSTGFAFARIQRDSAAIMDSLLQHGHPFDVPRTEWPYRLIEPLMLWAMARHGELTGSVLGTLFKVGSTRRILNFLDEKGMPI